MTAWKLQTQSTVYNWVVWSKWCSLVLTTSKAKNITSFTRIKKIPQTYWNNYSWSLTLNLVNKTQLPQRLMLNFYRITDKTCLCSCIVETVTVLYKVQNILSSEGRMLDHWTTVSSLILPNLGTTPSHSGVASHKPIQPISWIHLWVTTFHAVNPPAVCLVNLSRLRLAWTLVHVYYYFFRSFQSFSVLIKRCMKSSASLNDRLLYGSPC